MVEEDIKRTFENMNKEFKSIFRPNYSSNSEMYTFATENLSGYLYSLDVKNKNVLTVISSGDQLINLALLGAKKVDCFDINRNANYMANLKIAALKVLDYEEFLDFFSSHEKDILKQNDNNFIGILGSNEVLIPIGENPKYLDYDIYMKVRSELDNDTAYFFDKLYEKFNSEGKLLKDSKYLFYTASKSDAIKNNIYLQNASNYYQARNLIENIDYTFYNLDIFNIDTLPNKYDIVMLSNIYDYIDKVEQIGDINETRRILKKFGIEYEMTENLDIKSDIDYIELLNDKLRTILNPNAKIVGAYKYHYEENSSKEIELFTGAFKLKKYAIDKSGSKSIIKINLFNNIKKYKKRKSEYLRKKTLFDVSQKRKFKLQRKGIIKGMNVIVFPSSMNFDDSDGVIVFNTSRHR